MVKTFTVAGVSFHNGRWAVRYANSKGRKAVLVKNGHEGVKLFELPYAGAKEDAVDFLLNKDLGAEANEAVKAEARALGFVL